MRAYRASDARVSRNGVHRATLVRSVHLDSGPARIYPVIALQRHARRGAGAGGQWAGWGRVTAIRAVHDIVADPEGGALRH